MESEADFSAEEDDELKSGAQTGKENAKKNVKGKKKKNKKKKQKKIKLPKDMIMNEKGEIVPVKEYILEKTLSSTTTSLHSCQERLQVLYLILIRAATNEELQATLVEQEQDALQVITVLHKDAEKKDNQIREIQIQMKKIEQDSKNQIELVRKEYELKMEDTIASLNEKEAAFKIMQQEFIVIKDFRRKRQDLMKALDDSKLELEDTEKRHREVITRLEKKFFSEKIRLQKEANQKIGDLASQAHKEAVSNLETTTKDVYKENIRMSDALLFHVKDGEELAKSINRLAAVNHSLSQEKELHSVIVKEKIMASKQQELEIKNLKKVLQEMEHSLTHVVREFEQERKIIGDIAKKELEGVKKVVLDLTTKLATKAVEMRHIKRLAQHILDQRTEMEEFFLESLEQVKSKIREKKIESIRNNQIKYKESIKDALKSKAVIPPLKSLRPNGHARELLSFSEETNLREDKSAVSLKELSWEDKEKVLRILFAKMNGVSLDNDSEKIEKSRIELEKEKRHRSGFAAEDNSNELELHEPIEVNPI